MNPLLVAIGFLSTVSAIAPPHLDTEVEYHGRSRRRRQYLRAGNQTGLFGSKRNHLIGDVLSAEFLDERQRSSPTALARNADLALEVIQQTGKFQPLVLLMRFTDHKSRELPKPMYYDQLWNSEDLGDNTPIGSKSVKRYLKRNSYGMLDVHASITDWIDTDNTEGYYSFGMSGLTQQFSKSILPVLTQLDLMGYDFSQNDVNGDKIIDNLMVRADALNWIRKPRHAKQPAFHHCRLFIPVIQLKSSAASARPGTVTIVVFGRMLFRARLTAGALKAVSGSISTRSLLVCAVLVRARWLQLVQ